MQVLIDFIKSFEADSFGEVGVFFGPVLEDEFEVRANPGGLLE